MDEEQDRTTTEVHATDEPRGYTRTTRTARASTAGPGLLLYKIIWLIAGIIIALLALRMIFLLLAANQAAPFVGFIYGLSDVFAWPFYGIFNYTPVYHHSVFELSSLVAIIIYALIAWGLGKLVTLGSVRTDV